jgi:tRNA 2-thiouridine synthesizing protein A
LEIKEVIVDARGHKCPVPTLRLQKALQTAVRVRLLADDAMARIDIPHFVQSKGHSLLDLSLLQDYFSFLIERSKDESSAVKD